ncbi:unnamed protein product [Brassica oleracea]
MMSSRVDHLVKLHNLKIFLVPVPPLVVHQAFSELEKLHEEINSIVICPPAAVLLSYFPLAFFPTTPSPRLSPPLSDLDSDLIHAHVQYVYNKGPK